VTRASGISVPLFAVPTTRSWGIGEFPDLVDLAGWAAGAGQSIVQILPVMELPDHERSPYSALTSFALDPTYISLPLVPDFDALGGEQALPDADRALLAELRQARRVLYEESRRLKQPWLRRYWDRFALVELW
jgi:4-alpha-glucanotransferase